MRYWAIPVIYHLSVFHKKNTEWHNLDLQYGKNKHLALKFNLPGSFFSQNPGLAARHIHEQIPGMDFSIRECYFQIIRLGMDMIYSQL